MELINVEKNPIIFLVSKRQHQTGQIYEKLYTDLDNATSCYKRNVWDMDKQGNELIIDNGCKGFFNDSGGFVTLESH